MGFWVKKFVAFWFMPLPFSLLFLISGWLLVRSKRRGRAGWALLGIGIALLLVLSNKAFSAAILRPLELTYSPLPEFSATTPPPASLNACRYVVVLGGGHRDAPGVSAINKLSPAARGRLMEGLRLLRAEPGAKLIVSGGADPGGAAHADVLADAAVSLGTDPARIIRFDATRDTEDEAQALRRTVGDAPFALVTSAWHMPRAMALMRQAGLHPLACPADFSALPAPGFRFRDYTWDTDSLERSTKAVYERLGYLWLRLRGKTPAPEKFVSPS